MSTCRSCGAEIIWAVTDSGKRIPMDALPVIPKGLFVLMREDGASALAPEAISIASDRCPFRLFQSHFATCPNADEHRKA